MSTPGFVHLHVHSQYSFHSGTASLRDLIAAAKADGMRALALTDTERMSGLILFYKLCLEQGIKPILGVELLDPTHADSVPSPQAGKSERHDQNDSEGAPIGGPKAPFLREGSKVVLLARNAQGYADLCEIVTRRHVERGFSLARALAKPWPDLFILCRHPDLLRHLARTPNKARLFGELVNHDFESRALSREVETLCRACDIPLLASGDIYFARPAEWETHRLLRAIGLNASLSLLERDDTAPRTAYFRTEADMRRAFPNHGEALQNAGRLADACVADLHEKSFGKWIMPAIAVPAEHTPESYLAQLAGEGLRENYGGSSQLEKAELLQEMELKVIGKLGYASYFLMVKEVRDFANERFQTRYRRPRDCTILRGSAANSLTFYNLGVSDLDPIRYDLYFQRFLNEDRASPPDADLDFGWDEREEVLDYVADRFGRDRVAITCTLNHFRRDAAFRETAKVFGYTEAQVTEIMESHKTRGKRLEDSQISHILALAETVKGKPRFLGQHPGGLIITNQPICRHVACEYSGGLKNRLVTQVDMHSGIDDLGLIKFDLLGNGSLSVLRDTLKQLEEQGLADPCVWDLEKCYRDARVGSIIGKGRTRGIFYIESPAQTRLNKKADARTFEEITITSSLVRPAGTAYTQTFVERHRKMKKGVVDWEFLHPSLIPILKESHDVCAFQEDVTKICHHVAGLTYKQADGVRKMMNSQHEGQVESEQWKKTASHFIEGCMNTSGLTLKQALTLWERVSSFTGFSFCKSHSASYAQLSFQCAYLKAYYPAQFLSAVLSNNHGFYAREVYLDEARRWGLSILPMNINESRIGYWGKHQWIRPGFMHLRSISQPSLVAVVEERARGGPYCNLLDFLRRVPVGRKETENLVLVGAFDGFGMSQPELLFLLDESYGRLRPDRPDLFAGQGGGLGSAWGAEKGWGAKRPPLTDYSRMQKCMNEMRLLGYMLSGNVLDILDMHPAARDAVPAADLHLHAGKRVKVFGKPVTERMHRVAGSGKIMQFLTLEDKTECVDVILWPAVYDRFADTLAGSGPFEIRGRVTGEWDAYSLEAEFVRAVDFSPNQIDFETASERLAGALTQYRAYADIKDIRAA